MQKITIQVNNVELEGFDNISISRDMENFCGTYSFEAFSQNSTILPLYPSQKCNILVDGNLLLTGSTDRINTGYRSDEFSIEHFINIYGRDITSPIVDSSLNGNINFNSPISFKDIIKTITKDFTFKPDVIMTGNIKDFSAEELASADEGNNIFEFIEKLARLRGALLRTSTKGNIIIENGDKTKLSVKLLNQISGKKNNILEAGLEKDYSQRYYKYQAFSQTNLSSGIDAEPNLNQTGIYFDKDIYVNKDKYLNLESESSFDSDTNSTRAEWEGKIRAARSEVYTCKVNGFVAEYNNGKPSFWDINKLIYVKDDFLGINKTLLIKSVNFEYSSRDGSMTTLELIDKDAYLVEAQ